MMISIPMLIAENNAAARALRPTSVGAVRLVTASDAWSLFHSDFNGTSAMGYCDVPQERLTAFATAHGVNVFDRENMCDPECGYDGWEIRGYVTIDGTEQPFNLYTRWGVVRIGGHTPLLVNALNTALAALTTQE